MSETIQDLDLSPARPWEVVRFPVPFCPRPIHQDHSDHEGTAGDICSAVVCRAPDPSLSCWNSAGPCWLSSAESACLRPWDSQVVWACPH